uniref:SUI1 domain-containing protein n=1 Tax=Trichuris muris TaxID=70415 RepID=A0A5S6Q6T2_TRIMR
MQLFKSAFTVKRQLTMGQKDTRAFGSKLALLFPKVSQEFDYLFSEPMTVVTALIQNRSSIEVYVVQKVPMFFAYEESIYPTVYFLWKFPDAVITLPTTVQVYSRIINGSDLMAPGIVNVAEIGKFEKGVPCAIRTTNNDYPFAVGQLIKSSIELAASPHGKCVRVFHVNHDFLWKNGPRTLPPNVMLEEEIEQCQSSKEKEEENKDSDAGQEENQSSSSPNRDSAKFLAQALKALKGLGPSQLPMFANVFYGSVLLRSVPKEDIIDVRRTKYKKFSRFLDDLSSQGIVELSSEKGAVKILSINKKHNQFCELQKASPGLEGREGAAYRAKEQHAGDIVAPKLSEKYGPKAKLVHLIKATGIHANKNTVFTMNEFREHVTNYVNISGLKRDHLIYVDEMLSNCLPRDGEDGPKYPVGSTIDWRTLFHILAAEQLQPIYDVTYGDHFVERHKGPIPNIEISTAFRRGGKMVTLVNNLEAHQIDAAQFAHAIQPVLASASTLNFGLSRMVGAQVQVQGNHVAKIQKYLIEQCKTNWPKLRIFTNSADKGRPQRLA